MIFYSSLIFCSSNSDSAMLILLVKKAISVVNLSMAATVSSNLAVKLVLVVLYYLTQ